MGIPLSRRLAKWLTLIGMTIKHWPKADRPREKLMERGPGALTDAELLALFLGTGCNGLNALEQAQLLVQAHGPLRRLLDMDVRQLKKLPGLGLARACELVAALEPVSYTHLTLPTKLL